MIDPLYIQGEKDFTVPTGSVQLTVPRFMFESRNGDSNAYMYGDDKQILTELVQDGGTTQGSMVFTYHIDGDSYILTNSAPLPGGYVADIGIEYRYTPAAIKGGYTSSGTFGATDAVYAGDYYTHEASFPLNIVASEYMDAVTDNSQKLSLEFHSNVWNNPNAFKLRENKDSNHGIYLSWQSQWGEKPADADDYFYVIDYLDYAFNRATQPYYVEVSVPEGQEGTFVGALGRPSIPSTDQWQHSVGVGVNNSVTVASSSASLFNNYENIAVGDYSVFKYRVFSYYPPYYTYSYGPGTAPDTLSNFSSNGNNTNTANRRMAILTKYPKTILTTAQAAGVDLWTEGVPVTHKVDYKVYFEDSNEQMYYAGSAETDINICLAPPGEPSGMSKGKYAKWTAGSYVDNGSACANTDGQSQLLIDNSISLHQNTGSYTESGLAYVLRAKVYPKDVDENGTLLTPVHIEIHDSDLYISELQSTSKTYWKKTLEDILDVQHGQKLDSEDYEFTNLFFTMDEYEGTYNREYDTWEMSAVASTDYDRMSPIKIYVNGAHWANVVKTSSGFNLVDKDSGTVLMQKVSLSNRIRLPEGTYDFRIEHDTDYYFCNLAAIVGVSIHPTEDVKSFVRENVNNNKWTGFTNNASFKATQNNGNTVIENRDCNYNLDATTYEIRSVSYASTFVQSTWSMSSEVSYDYENETESRMIRFLVENPLNDTNNTFKNYPRKGTFYCLLPEGTYANEAALNLYNTIYLTNAISRDYYTVSHIDNWEGSNRQMLIVDFDFPDDYRLGDSTSAYLNIYFPLVNPFVNIKDRGVTVTVDSAYVDDSNRTIYNFHAGSTDYSNINRLRTPEYFQNLKAEDHNYIAFAQHTVTYFLPNNAEGNFTKRAYSASVPSYRENSKVFSGETYEYRLIWANGKETYSDQLMFCDVLEDEDTSEWKGELDFVDASSIADKVNARDASAKCNPIIKYSAVKPTDAQKWNADDPIWSESKPDKVVDVLVDCRKDTSGNDFTLGMDTYGVVYIHMKAPTDPALRRKTTVNKAAAQVRISTTATPSEADVIEYPHNIANVLLRAPELTIEKNASYKNTATNKTVNDRGTEDSPVPVNYIANQTIKYTLKVTNTDDVAQANNAVIEDVIPDGLTVNTANITVSVYKPDGTRTSNNVAPGTVGIATQQTGQKLTFTITRMLAGYYYVFTIPAVQEEEVIKTTLYENTGKVVSLSNLDIDPIESETTYHKVVRQYKVDYTAAGDSVYGMPGGVNGTVLPTSFKDSLDGTTYTLYEYEDNVSYCDKQTTDWNTSTGKDDSGIPGIWSFSDWEPADYADEDKLSSSFIIRKDTVVEGAWTFTPTTYTLSYNVADDTTWGHPEDSVIPSAVEDINYKDPVTLESPLTTTDGNALRASDNEEVPGTWTFAGWNGTATLEGDPITGIEHVTKDETVYGRWTFTPTVYKVSYTVEEDPSYGAPTDAAAPEDDNSPYDWKDLVSIKDDLISAEKEAQLSDGSSITGRWIFSGWDKEDFNITEDTVIYGSWKFMPTFDLIVEKVWKDNNNEDKVRPSSVTITILANGTPMEDRSQRITASNNWTVTISGLDVYDDGGNEIVYTVVESAVNSYSASYQTSADGAKITITNSHAKTAYTGDENPTVLFAALSAMSLFGLFGLSYIAGFFRKKEVN